MDPTTRPRISFGKIALRMGAVTSQDLQKARAVRTEKGGSLEAILIELGALNDELARAVKDAFVRACAVCETCGRRTDTTEREDWTCRCGGTFVSLEKSLEEEGIELGELEEDLLNSEAGDESASDPGDYLTGAGAAAPEPPESPES